MRATDSESVLLHEPNLKYNKPGPIRNYFQLRSRLFYLYVLHVYSSNKYFGIFEETLLFSPDVASRLD